MLPGIKGRLGKGDAKIESQSLPEQVCGLAEDFIDGGLVGGCGCRLRAAGRLR